MAAEWQVLPERQSLAFVGAERALLPVVVRNESDTAAFARLAVRVTAEDEGPHPRLERWLVVPGERQQVGAGGTARFLVLVDPPPGVAIGRYVLSMQLVLGPHGKEQATDVVRTVPASVGTSWAIQFAASVPSSGLISRTESRVTFAIAGPPGAAVRVEAHPARPFDDVGKFPSKFLVDRSRFALPLTGRDSVDVVVVLGTSEVMFEAVLVDDGSGSVVARSGPVLPEFEHPDEPFEPA